jgi:hypothetical protein
MYTIEQLNSNALCSDDMQALALITAAGFGRPDDAHNRADTEDHVVAVDTLLALRGAQGIDGFAALRGSVWR